MRALMLQFCFEDLQADSVTSLAFVDNAASNAVSRPAGYEFDGLQRVTREGVAVQNRWRMSSERWGQVRDSNQDSPVTALNLRRIAPCRPHRGRKTTWLAR
jgi:hypothetical protein